MTTGYSARHCRFAVFLASRQRRWQLYDLVSAQWAPARARSRSRFTTICRRAGCADCCLPSLTETVHRSRVDWECRHQRSTSATPPALSRSHASTCHLISWCVTKCSFTRLSSVMNSPPLSMTWVSTCIRSGSSPIFVDCYSMAPVACWRSPTNVLKCRWKPAVGVGPGPPTMHA